MSEELEYCLVCDEQTGKAGKGDDSLYHFEIGPFCEHCYDLYCAENDTALARKDALLREAKGLLGFTAATKTCPSCDGSGAMVVAEDADGSPHVMQCQWCDERDKILTRIEQEVRE